MQQATELTLQLYGVSISEISTLPSYMDQNFLMVDKEGTKYVLKIMNSEESKNSSLLEAQTLAMSFLYQHGVPAHTAIPTTAGQLMSMEEIGNESLEASQGYVYCITSLFVFFFVQS